MTVNVTYFLCREVIDRRKIDAVSDEARRMMRLRSLVTIALFASASVVALLSPIAALALICFCLFLYLRPAAPVISPTQPSKGSGHE